VSKVPTNAAAAAGASAAPSPDIARQVISKVKGAGGTLGRGVVGVGAAGLAVGAASLLWDPVADLVGGMEITGGAKRRFKKAYAQDRAMMRARLLSEQRQKRIQALKAENMALLARTKPHLFLELSAGMKLPEDAVVIGGQPRQDLLEQVAEAMSQQATGGV